MRQGLFDVACWGGGRDSALMVDCVAPEVEVVEVVQRDVPVYHEWIGTTEGMVNAQIRAQVTGYLLRRTYTEGGFVKQGDLLFEIDSRRFLAAVIRREAISRRPRLTW